MGDRKDSIIYVNMKKKAAEKIGVQFCLKELPNSSGEKDIRNVVQELNERSFIGFFDLLLSGRISTA